MKYCSLLLFLLLFLTLPLGASEPEDFEIDVSQRDLMSKNLAYRKDSFVPYDYYERVILPVQSGFRMIARQRYDLAEDLFNGALSWDSTYAFAINGLGNIALDQQDFISAEKYFRESIRLHPRSALSYNNLGNVFILQNDYINGEIYLKMSLTLDPNSSYIYYNLGNVYLKTGRTAQAEKMYKKALALDPRMCKAHYNLALINETRGDINKAVSEYDLAVKACPGHVKSVLNLAAYHAENGNVEEALELYRTAVSVNKDAELYKAMGNLYYNMGKPVDSHFAYEEAVALDSSDLEAVFFLAQSYYFQNMTFSAKKWCEYILRIDPEYLPARELCDTLK